MAIPLASWTASATAFPMRMVIRPAFRKAEAMEKLSSFDAARRSASELEMSILQASRSAPESVKILSFASVTRSATAKPKVFSF